MCIHLIHFLCQMNENYYTWLFFFFFRFHWDNPIKKDRKKNGHTIYNRHFGSSDFTVIREYRVSFSLMSDLKKKQIPSTPFSPIQDVKKNEWYPLIFFYTFTHHLFYMICVEYMEYPWTKLTVVLNDRFWIKPFLKALLYSQPMIESDFVHTDWTMVLNDRLKAIS